MATAADAPGAGEAELDGASQLLVAQPEHVGGLGDDGGVHQPPSEFEQHPPQQRPGQADVGQGVLADRGGVLGPPEQPEERGPAARPEPGDRLAGLVLPALGRQPLALVRVVALPPQVELHRLQQGRGIVGRHRADEVQVVDRMAEPVEVVLEAGMPLLPQRLVHTGRRGPGALRTRPAPPSVR